MTAGRSKTIRMLILIVAFAGLLPAVGCHRTKPAEEVVIYTSADQPRSKPILEQFEAETGIKVRAVYDIEASKTTGLVNRLIAEADHPKADVFWNSEVTQTASLARDGMFQPYFSPVAKDIPAEFKDPKGLWTGIGLRARVILVNTDLVPEDQMPGTLQDLFDSRWKPGETGISQPLFGTCFSQAAVMYQIMGAGKAKELFEKIKSSGMQVTDGNALLSKMIADGTVKAGIVDTDDAGEVLRDGAHVKMIFPDKVENGALYFPGSIALLAHCKHPENGKKLVDWLLSPRVDRKIVDMGYFYRPIRSFRKAQGVSWGQVAEDVPTVKEDLQRIFVR